MAVSRHLPPPDTVPPWTDTDCGPFDARLGELEMHRSIAVRDRLELARAVEREALAVRQTAAVMRARLVIADMMQRVGETPNAVQMAADVHRWAAEVHATKVLARSHLVLSTMFEMVGEPASSLDHAVRGVDLLDEHSTPRERGLLVLRLADALAFSGLGHQARRRYTEAAYLFAAMRDPERSLIVLNNLAVMESELGNAAAAAAAATRLEREARPEDMNPDFAETIARARLVSGELAAAERAARLGQELVLEQGDTTAVAPAEMSMTLAEILLASGRHREAQAELDRCREICTRRGLAGMRAQALELQARLHASCGEFERAYAAHREFHAATAALHSQQHETAARSREAVLRTTEALRDAEQFRLQARVDPLTDLYNRRFVDETLPAWLAEAQADGSPLAVALIDLDHFKLVNDEHSHATGDQVIHLVARTFAQIVGTAADEVFVARIGGEEFLVVDRVHDVVEVTATVERLRDALDARDWSAVADGLHVTMSAGLAIAAASDTISSLLERADQQLYAAKAAGRNRVITAAP